MVNSPHKGQWRGALMFSLICAPMNGWVNNHEAGDLRRHRCHYDGIVINYYWPDANRNVREEVQRITTNQHDQARIKTMKNELTWRLKSTAQLWCVKKVRLKVRLHWSASASALFSPITLAFYLRCPLFQYSPLSLHDVQFHALFSWRKRTRTRINVNAPLAKLNHSTIKS